MFPRRDKVERNIEIRGKQNSLLHKGPIIKSVNYFLVMLRSQSELQLLPPGTITKRTLGDRSFMASAPKLWNRLPSNIRAVNDLNCFKTLLKTHLFRQAFSCLLL